MSYDICGFLPFFLFMQYDCQFKPFLDLEIKECHFKMIRIYNAAESMNLKAKFLGGFFCFAFPIIFLFYVLLY